MPVGADGFARRPHCPFCDAELRSVKVKINEWSDAPADAFVEIICDGCHQTVFEKEYSG